MSNKNGRVTVITGPTASGKTDLAVKLALQYGCDVISADSRQVYAGIPIVTAQPTEEEKRGVRHHLIGHLSLDSYYSASQFEKDALQLIEEQLTVGEHAIVCGGSMLYVDALCNGIDDLPTIPEDFREELKKEVEVNGNGWLTGQLKILDPVYYCQVDLKNFKRIFHAVEVSLYAGKPYTSFLTGRKKERPFEIEILTLEPDRETLFSKINGRVDRMIAGGLEEEARSVYHLKGLNSLNTVGLKEMFAYFDGNMDRQTAIERIKKNTRVFAKKQLTWLKNRSGHK